jgi:hypothetical protein
MYCAYHSPDPAIRQEVERQRRTGGKARGRAAQLASQDFPEVTIETAADVRVMLTDGVNRLLSGRIDTKTLNSISHAGRCALEALRLEGPPPDPRDRLVDKMGEYLQTIPAAERNIVFQQWLTAGYKSFGDDEPMHA